MSETFKNTWLAQPSLSQHERHIHQLAMEYHSLCEGFDRSICSGRRSGIAIPENGYQLATINKHAREVRKLIAQREGIPERDLSRAIRETSREFEQSIRAQVNNE